MVLVNVLMLSPWCKRINYLSAVHAECDHAVVASQVLASYEIVFPYYSVAAHTELEALISLKELKRVVALQISDDLELQIVIQGP